MASERYRPFGSVLVANRGEIAVRVLRAGREAGLRTIAVASDADTLAPHALLADETVAIGPGPAAQSYLDMDKLLDAARSSGAEALHPGYGFYAESAEFARRVEAAGIVWVGPPPDVIEALGNKVRAKELAAAAGVPVLGGYQGDVADAAAAEKAAADVGYPLLVKAAAGGGGRGMRIVASAADLRAALESASREAQAAFGSGRVFLEPLVQPARHVEVQIVGDSHGRVMHFGERECSVQRRYQKVIEESPSPAVDPELRERMGQAAVALAREAGYVGAGTVEFLLGPDGRFHFLEVNTRLQVEHPVTELVTGHDLVGLQFAVAAGEPLPLGGPIELRGHAIELRVCAEDPARQYAPQSGPILYLELPTGPGVRVDAGVRAGYEIPTHYDSLLLKLLAHGETRREAINRAVAALDDLVLVGPTTNAALLRAVLVHPAFVAGDLSTRFLDDHLADWRPPSDVPAAALVAAAAADWLTRGARGSGSSSAEEVPSPWRTLPGWRSVTAEGGA